MSAEDGVRIGLEVHVYLRTRAKLFCACDADFLAATRPNANVCHVCTGQPGSKPQAPNEAALARGVDVARALGSTLRSRTRFLRKHYFYPDLPSNYQRTTEPLAEGGSLDGVRIREMHVEEDPGAYDLATGLVDYSRAGAPLLEIVTEPDLDSPAHARRFLQELRLVLAYLDAWREEAGVKCDCNLSVHGGERAEVKNVNSVRNVERALQHEMERQLAAHAAGEPLVRETRHFDETTGRTTRLRLKESEADYRFLPDPDILAVDVAAIADARPVVEAPLARRARVARLVGVPESDASPLLEDRPLLDAFEHAAARVPPRVAYDYFVRDLRADLAFAKRTFTSAGLAADDVGALLVALHERRVTPHVATRLMREAIAGARLRDVLAAEQRVERPEEDAVRVAARAALDANPKAVADYRSGKETAVNFLVGAAMKALRGRADAAAVRAAVLEALASS